jgi:hypothetical protein
MSRISRDNAGSERYLTTQLYVYSLLEHVLSPTVLHIL